MLPIGGSEDACADKISAFVDPIKRAEGLSTEAGGKK